MTKEITKARIIQEIQDKFKLREFEPEIFRFSEMVVPTYGIEQHLQTWIVEQQDVTVSSAPTPKLFFTVPDNERWTLRAYNIIFLSAGAHTVTGLYLSREPFTYLYLDMVLGQSVSYAINLPMAVILEAGDSLWVYVDSYTSTANLRLVIDYMKEELR